MEAASPPTQRLGLLTVRSTPRRSPGIASVGRGGYPIISPFVAVADRPMRQMKGFLIEFGMTPSARSRVNAEGKEAEPASSD